jgi:hypothetical protein
MATPAPEMTPRDLDPDWQALQQQVHQLQERLAFYEGFDLLIQDNVAHARELFRLAAQERETAASVSDRARRGAIERETQLRSELEAIAGEVDALAAAVANLSARIARALGESSRVNGWDAVATTGELPVAVVVHGVPSARTALSLQRFIASLPQVADVSAREFVGGVLRLDARVQEPLQVAQFRGWEDPRRIETLTDLPDVIELALQEPVSSSA